MINNINQWWVKYLDQFWGYFIEFSDESFINVLGYIPKGMYEIGYDSGVKLDHDLTLQNYINVGDVITLPKRIRFINYNTWVFATQEEETFGWLNLSEIDLKVVKKRIDKPSTLFEKDKSSCLIFVVDLPEGSSYEFNDRYVKDRLFLKEGKIETLKEYPIR